MRWAKGWRGRRLSWAEDLDVSGGRIQAAWWSWLVLGVSVAALLAAMDQLDRVQAEQVDAQAQLKRLSRADRQLRMNRAIAQAPAASLPAQPGQPPAPDLQGPALAEALAMTRLLAYPWADHLGRIEHDAAARRAVLTAMSVNLDAATASTGTPGEALWRLQAAVIDDAAALAWAGLLPGGQVISRDRLAQPFSAAWGQYTLRVEVQMRAVPVASGEAS